MICFQLLVSLVFWTTESYRQRSYVLLWLLSIIGIFGILNNLSLNVKSKSCCDLLSIIGIFGILNNLWCCSSRLCWVVICFQLLVSLVFWTKRRQMNIETGCDLLSIIGIFGILNNFRIWLLLCRQVVIATVSLVFWTTAHGILRTTAVVICFQLLVSLVFWTTRDWKFDTTCSCDLLSIGIFVFWTTYAKGIAGTASCDLLSIIGIFGILNNFYLYICNVLIVVICFQLLVSLVFWTTGALKGNNTMLLWFAFNYWYLWYSEQQTSSTPQASRCCDLLSIIGIFGILNNSGQFSTCCRMLWFAFNYWYLWYSEQQPGRSLPTVRCCDLLSIIGIFGILNNE